MVDHSTAFNRPDFYSFDVAILLQARINYDVPPRIGEISLDEKILGHPRDKFGRSDPPFVVIKFHRHWHIGRIPSAGAGIPPLHNRLNFIFRKPTKVPEIYDA